MQNLFLQYKLCCNNLFRRTVEICYFHRELYDFKRKYMKNGHDSQKYLPQNTTLFGCWISEIKHSTTSISLLERRPYSCLVKSLKVNGYFSIKSGSAFASYWSQNARLKFYEFFMLVHTSVLLRFHFHGNWMDQ